MLGPFDEDAAIKSFEKYFKSKTGNAWENRHNFVNKANKYIFVEIEHDAAKAQAQAQVWVPATALCHLHAQTQPIFFC